MKGNLKKFLISAVLMSFGLAIYQVWFMQPFQASLEAQGSQVGVGETALGYFGAICIITLISWVLTRNVGGQQPT